MPSDKHLERMREGHVVLAGELNGRGNVNIGNLHRRLYLANAAVLITHQIDAAYWHEWQLFGLPGGIQLFLLLNLPIALLVVLGAMSLGARARAGIVISWLLVASGLFAVVFHGLHILRGDLSFMLPVSLGLLCATFVLSVAQAGSLLRSRVQPPPSAHLPASTS